MSPCVPERERVWMHCMHIYPAQLVRAQPLKMKSTLPPPLHVLRSAANPKASMKRQALHPFTYPEPLRGVLALNYQR